MYVYMYVYVCLCMDYVLQATACMYEYYLYKYARSIQGLLNQLFALYISPSICLPQ